MCDGFWASGELEKSTSHIPPGNRPGDWRLVAKLVIRAHEPCCAVTEQLLGSKSADCAVADSPPRNNTDSAEPPRTNAKPGSGFPTEGIGVEQYSCSICKHTMNKQHAVPCGI